MKYLCICKKIVALSLLILISGCATQKPYDYTNLLEKKPRSILVLPPANQSVEVNAPYIFLSTISKPLVEKGYYVFPVAVIDQFMKENGFTIPDEIAEIPLIQIEKYISPDAVLYTTITDWGQKYRVLNSTTIVRAKLELVDTKTGTLLWQGVAFAQKESGDGGGGVAGALIGAVVTQIMSSMKNITPELSRQANNNLINNQQNGLLEGPLTSANK